MSTTVHLPSYRIKAPAVPWSPRAHCVHRMVGAGEFSEQDLKKFSTRFLMLHRGVSEVIETGIGAAMGATLPGVLLPLPALALGAWRWGSQQPHATLAAPQRTNFAQSQLGARTIVASGLATLQHLGIVAALPVWLAAGLAAGVLGALDVSAQDTPRSKLCSSLLGVAVGLAVCVAVGWAAPVGTGMALTLGSLEGRCAVVASVLLSQMAVRRSVVAG